jgi:hypothetical protein
MLVTVVRNQVIYGANPSLPGIVTEAVPLGGNDRASGVLIATGMWSDAQRIGGESPTSGWSGSKRQHRPERGALWTTRRWRNPHFLSERKGASERPRRPDSQVSNAVRAFARTRRSITIALELGCSD